MRTMVFFFKILFVAIFIQVVASKSVVKAQANWELQDFRSDTGFSDIEVLSLKDAYVLGTGTLGKTVDGGQNWVSLQAPAYDIYGLGASSMNDLFIGSYTNVYRSTDGGLTFSVKRIGCSNGIIPDISVVNSEIAYANGCSTNHAVMKTTDGGENWIQLQNSPSLFHESTLEALSESTVIAKNDYSNLYRTTDGGVTWSLLFAPPVGGVLTWQSVSPLVIWASVYTDNWPTPTDVYVTEDGGVNWVKKISLDNTGFNISAISEDEVWFFMGDGQIFHTIDGGNTWLNEQLGFEEPFGVSRVKFFPCASNSVSSYVIWAVSTDGKIARRDDCKLQVEQVTPSANPVLLSTSVFVNANFNDPLSIDIHTAIWNWGDGSSSAGTVTEANGSGTVSGSHFYTSAGVYTVTLTVTSSDNRTGQSTFKYVVVYDPAAGYVTGSGTLTSPSGAYTADPTVSGKAIFGFVSKYQNGANVPTGSTRFNFHLANLNFRSTDYQWMVVGGSRAQYKGTGTINNSGSYSFILTAVDGDVSGGGGTEKFRIKIWDTSTGTVVYDNQLGAPDSSDPTTVIDNGSIIIHH